MAEKTKRIFGYFLSTFVVVVLTSTGSVRAGEGKDLEFKTARGLATITPLEHATFVMKWNGRVFFFDPVGGAAKFQSFGEPDVIFITDIHGDHLNVDTVKGVRTGSTSIVAPPVVVAKLKEAGLDGKRILSLSNGKTAIVTGNIQVETIPMYNLTEERKKFHPKGRGNGYVLDLAGTRVYISGDTEDIPEMRELKNIDVAFVCMNLPFTMTAERAASAVAEFKPKIVYPYHYRGRGDGTQDPKKFKELVEKSAQDVEVRLLSWYPKKR